MQRSMTEPNHGGLAPPALAGMGPLLVAIDGDEAVATAFSRARQLAELAHGVFGAEGAWPLEVVIGDDVASLARVARDRDACLVVTGRVHHGVVERALHGEMPLELVRAADVPVLAVPAAMTRLPRIAVVAVGEGTAGLRAASVAHFLLASAVEIHLVHVRAPAQALHERERREEGSEHEAGIQRGFDVVRQAWQLPADVTVRSRVLVGRPVTELLRYAHEVSADLLVAGLPTHPHGMPHRGLAMRLFHESPLAMLLVPVEHRASADANGGPSLSRESSRRVP